METPKEKKNGSLRNTIRGISSLTLMARGGFGDEAPQLTFVFTHWWSGHKLGRQRCPGQSLGSQVINWVFNTHSSDVRAAKEGALAPEPAAHETVGLRS